MKLLRTALFVVVLLAQATTIEPKFG